MLFSDKDLELIRAEYATTANKRDQLSIAYVRYNFQNERAYEYATQGFLRRLKILSRCLDNVFNFLPPDRGDLPVTEELSDAVINIQAFVFNVFGSVDNLAWIWVYEKQITRLDGSPIPKTWVGLTSRNELLRESFSGEFRTYLSSLDAWFGHIEDYRHALAHRIPLYIPPYVVRKRDEERYKELDVRMNEAIARGDAAEYNRLENEQKKFVEFRPWMTHSFKETEGTIVFHPQMIADFNTIVELGQKMLEELAR